jgi:hypothetical protein
MAFGLMTDANFEPQKATNQSGTHEEETVDPRDLVSKGGYHKHPRQIVENPAVTPQMLDEPQGSRAGDIREDRDEEC